MVGLSRYCLEQPTASICEHWYASYAWSCSVEGKMKTSVWPGLRMKVFTPQSGLEEDR
jgi:hypothetical protein